MDPEELTTVLLRLVEASQHPEITDATRFETPGTGRSGVRIDFEDGSTGYLAISADKRGRR